MATVTVYRRVFTKNLTTELSRENIGGVEDNVNYVLPDAIIETHPAESRSLDVAVLSHLIDDNLKSIRKHLR
jgi:hypothetical protein